MATNSDQPRPPEPTDRRRLILSVGWSLLIFVLCLFIPAGTLAWSKGWLLILVIVVCVAEMIDVKSAIPGQLLWGRQNNSPRRA